MTQVMAKLRYLRMSPRKTRLVVDVIRGSKVAMAQAQLKVMSKAAAMPVLKLLNSAIANAEHNFKLDKKNLFVKTIMVDGGPVLKRSTPKAFGRATPIHRRTSHITIILDTLGVQAGKGVQAAVVKEDVAVTEEAPAAKTVEAPTKTTTKKETVKKEVKAKK
ncbi:50S ribosomal protein L22 [Candidatus Uhrbacteria bacterium]|nr:50S ribosomal protein L22 [Candidatus Uhrbacteria bacterium]